MKPICMSSSFFLGDLDPFNLWGCGLLRFDDGRSLVQERFDRRVLAESKGFRGVGLRSLPWGEEETEWAALNKLSSLPLLLLMIISSVLLPCIGHVRLHKDAGSKRRGDAYLKEWHNMKMHRRWYAGRLTLPKRRKENTKNTKLDNIQALAAGTGSDCLLQQLHHANPLGWIPAQPMRVSPCCSRENSLLHYSKSQRDKTNGSTRQTTNHRQHILFMSLIKLLFLWVSQVPPCFSPYCGICFKQRSLRYRLNSRRLVCFSCKEGHILLLKTRFEFLNPSSGYLTIHFQ